MGMPRARRRTSRLGLAPPRADAARRRAAGCRGRRGSGTRQPPKPPRPGQHGQVERRRRGRPAPDRRRPRRTAAGRRRGTARRRRAASVDAVDAASTPGGSGARESTKSHVAGLRPPGRERDGGERHDVVAAGIEPGRLQVDGHEARIEQRLDRRLGPRGATSRRRTQAASRPADDARPAHTAKSVANRSRSPPCTRPDRPQTPPAASTLVAVGESGAAVTWLSGGRPARRLASWCDQPQAQQVLVGVDDLGNLCGRIEAARPGAPEPCEPCRSRPVRGPARGRGRRRPAGCPPRP